MGRGPGQTSAGAARCTRCDRRGSARSSAVDSTRSRAPAGARAAGSEDRTPPGHHLHSGADVIHHQNVGWSPDQARRAVGEQRHNEPKPVAPPPSEGGTRPSCGSSRSIPHDDRSWVGLRPRIGGGKPRAIARIEERAIGSAMWGWKGASVAADRRGSRRRRGLGHGFRHGSSSRGARCPFDRRTWRAAEALRYASSGLSHPRAACAQGRVRSMPDVYEIVYE